MTIYLNATALTPDQGPIRNSPGYRDRRMIADFSYSSPEDVEEMKSEDLLEQLIKALAGDYPELTRIILEERDLYLARSIWEVCGLPTEEPGHDTGQKEAEIGVEEEEDEGRVAVRQRSGRSQKWMDADEKGGGSTVERLSEPDENSHLLRQGCCCWCPEWPGLDVLPRVVVAIVGIGHVAGIKKAWNHASAIDKAELRRVKPTPRPWIAFRWVSRALIVSVFGLATYLALCGVYQAGHYLFQGTLYLYSRFVMSS